jgi:hypothetical protein
MFSTANHRHLSLSLNSPQVQEPGLLLQGSGAALILNSARIPIGSWAMQRTHNQGQDDINGNQCTLSGTLPNGTAIVLNALIYPDWVSQPLSAGVAGSDTLAGDVSISVTGIQSLNGQPLSGATQAALGDGSISANDITWIQVA